LIRSESERDEISRITGLPQRMAYKVLSELIGLGLLASETLKGPVSLRFPVGALDALFRQLFPEAVSY